MEENNLRRVFRVVIAVVIVGLLAAMAFIILRYRSDMNARSRKIASLVPEAAAYEDELNELRRLQETEEMKIYMPEGPGVAVVSFLINGGDTLETAFAYGKTYGFTPAILLNIDNDPDRIIETIAKYSPDVILYSQGNISADSIKRAKTLLDEAGLRDTGAYLLRASDDTEENREILLKSGISTLFLYGDNLTSAVEEDGTVELNYSYVNRSAYTPVNRLTALSDSEQGLLFAFDLAETTVTERQTNEIFRLIKEQADSGRIKIGSVADAVQTVKDRCAREKENLDAFEAVQEERNARIAELKAIIAEIYSHWDDTSEVSD